jgi:hypothetical protein
MASSGLLIVPSTTNVGDENLPLNAIILSHKGDRSISPGEHMVGPLGCEGGHREGGALRTWGMISTHGVSSMDPGHQHIPPVGANEGPE